MEIHEKHLHIKILSLALIFPYRNFKSSDWRGYIIRSRIEYLTQTLYIPVFPLLGKAYFSEPPCTARNAIE